MGNRAIFLLLGLLAASAALSQAGQALIILLLVTFLGRLLANRVLHEIFSSRSRELLVVTIIVIAVGMAWLTYAMGFSPALGAFLGGLIIGGSAFKYQALSEITPFRYCFNSLFFVSIGMLLNFEFIAQHFALLLLVILLIPTLKMLITTGAVMLIRIPLRIALVVGISLAGIGEFSFLLAYAGLKEGAISPFLYELIVSFAVISMMVTPVMVRPAPRVADAFMLLPGGAR